VIYGNLEFIFDADGYKTQYTYDGMDRVSRVLYPDGRSEEYVYNANGQIDYYKDLNGNLITHTVYDAAARLTQRTISKAEGVGGSDYEGYEYDGFNRVTSVSNDDSEVTFTYDDAGRLEKETLRIKGSVGKYYETFYQYDDNGNKTGITYPSKKEITIIPDALDRIDTITQKDKAAPLAKYGYEGVGKVTSKNLQGKLA